MTSPPALAAGEVHVWRVPLDAPAAPLRALLSADERARADRFFREEHRARFTVAHAWKRRLLATYVGVAPEAVRFEVGAHGKPSLAADLAACGVHFNLTHSGDLALVAVAAHGAVGVDVERWDARVEHLDLAERFFSETERRALRALVAQDAVVAGFFAAWSRKEAYLKATGHGITRGLHHFDVSLAPGEPAALLADRLDASATRRWAMRALDVGDGYSAAVVAGAPLHAVRLLDADPAR